MGDAEGNGGLSQAFHRPVYEETQLFRLRQFFREGLALVAPRPDVLTLESLFIGQGHLPGEHSPAQRYAGDDADVGLLCKR